MLIVNKLGKPGDIKRVSIGKTVVRVEMVDGTVIDYLKIPDTPVKKKA